LNKFHRPWPSTGLSDIFERHSDQKTAHKRPEWWSSVRRYDRALPSPWHRLVKHCATDQEESAAKRLESAEAAMAVLLGLSGMLLLIALKIVRSLEY
jgi:hypothetical protein